MRASGASAMALLALKCFIATELPKEPGVRRTGIVAMAGKATMMRGDDNGGVVH